MNAPFFRRRIVSLAQGGTQIYVNYSIKSLEINLPSKQEQQKCSTLGIKPYVHWTVIDDFDFIKIKISISF